MSRRVRYLSLALLLPLVLLALLGGASGLASQPPDSDKIDLALHERVQEDGDGQIRFIIYVDASADLTGELPEAKIPRRIALVQRLQQVAGNSQQALLDTLQQLQGSGAVSVIRPLWIVNAVIVEGQGSLVYRLAQRPDVARISLDARQQFLHLPDLQPQTAPPSHWNLKQIRAGEVWNGLGVRGEGVTIAVMDTGVDWTHPDLRENYRGWQASGVSRHEGSWFDAIENTAEGGPFDPNGHGTHVAGTALGSSTGVAPDAKWIAVRAFDAGGYATTGGLHVAFQWLLAPAGKPELAPDIINGSWSGSGNDTAFEEDLRILHEAGIATIFAVGNNGPEPNSIGAPAAYAGAVAVAAVDYRNEVTWFSGRGPSSLTSTPKPDLAAPGARIYATLPGGAYGYFNGTSMAAPHVSGVAALLLSANPGLDVAALTRAMTTTAQHVPAAGHDVHRGYGLLDAYSAVASQMMVAQIQGSVVAQGEPLPGATVTITNQSGDRLALHTDASGHYQAWVRPGQYRVQASQYGYVTSPPVYVQAHSDDTTFRNMELERVPYTVISGKVQAEETGEPVAGVLISVAGVPVTATTGAQGEYSLALPTGLAVSLSAVRTGFRLAHAELTLSSSAPVAQDFTLLPTQSILLVDSGRWYYDSQASYYENALHDAGYAFDRWGIYTPFEALPHDFFAQYDTVIWTAPQDAPGWIGSGSALITFLDRGGNLLVSGQHVARRDGISPTAHAWFTQYLQARYIGAPSSPYTVTGTSGLFSGLQFPLNAADSAANQQPPSMVSPAPGSLTRQVLTFDDSRDNSAAALQAGWCEPFRIVFFGFGLEGAASARGRSELIQRTLDHFEAPPVARAIALNPSQTNEVMLPGETLTVTFTLQNLSEVNTTTVTLDYNSEWEAHLSQSTVTLGPCQQHPVTLTLNTPLSLPSGARQAIELNATADYGAVAGASIVASVPQPVLLVADYRWYDESQAYRTALHDLQLPYDVWDTNSRGSPSAERLSAYDTILWFTGYDWYEPLTPAEIQSLQHYLDQGGRLFLSSQDYLYYHSAHRFTRDFLGVLDYQESLTSTVLLASDNAVLDDGAGPFTLEYARYRNFSDGLALSPSAHVHLWNNWGFAAGTAMSGDDWRSIFWSSPLELLPRNERAALLADITGWLGDFGDTEFEASPRQASASATRTYTVTVRNWQHAEVHTAHLTITVPSELSIVGESISDGIKYERADQALYWTDILEPGEEHTITFQAAPVSGLSAGMRLNVAARLTYDGKPQRWQRTVPTWIRAPDLTSSRLSVSSEPIRPNQLLTYTASLHNSSGIRAREVSATLTLPYGLIPITPTIWSSAGQTDWHGRQVQWQGALRPGATVSFTVVVSVTSFTNDRLLPAGLVVDDGVSTPLVRSHTVGVVPHRWFFPYIRK